ncbi:hypothetical protein MG293_013571 [Ovis ammon polii]|uniref:Uncharacterized protein n=1 Tax=Ovis ammon polii TaxID=230172 RepID=A0AAD4U1K8_OVIAM|nr:hypothetical protein MG293_013571 [Ovis ammon polii]
MVIFSWKDLGVVTLRFGTHLPSREGLGSGAGRRLRTGTGVANRHFRRWNWDGRGLGVRELVFRREEAWTGRGHRRSSTAGDSTASDALVFREAAGDAGAEFSQPVITEVEENSHHLHPYNCGVLLHRS